MRFGIWLPVHGGWLRTHRHEFDLSFDYALKLSLKAEALGFDYLYAAENVLNVVYGPDYDCVDPWVLLAGLATHTKRIELVGSTKPGFKLPPSAAHQFRDIDRLSHGRCNVNIVSGWWKDEFCEVTVPFLDHAARWERAREYIEILIGLWTRKNKFSYHGKYFQVANGHMGSRPVSKPYPRIWISGESSFAKKIAIDYGDVWMINGGSDQEIEKTISEVRGHATKKKRTLKFAMNAWVIQAESDAKARQRLDRLFADRDPKLMQYFRKVMADPKSGTTMWEGGTMSDLRMLDSNDGLQAGLVGSADTITGRIKALEKCGVDILLLQFENMMKGTVEFGRRVLPLLVSATKRSSKNKI